MAYASKQREIEYMTNFMREKYDRVQILRAKGDKAKLRAIAESRGVSMSAMLNGLIDDWLSQNGYDLSSMK